MLSNSAGVFFALVFDDKIIADFLYIVQMLPQLAVDMNTFLSINTWTGIQVKGLSFLIKYSNPAIPAEI